MPGGPALAKCSLAGAGAMRLAKQLLWQQSAHPVAFAPRAEAHPTTAQIFALPIGGLAGSEIGQFALRA